MAQFTGPSITDLPGWRVGLIFCIFFSIALVWDLGISALDSWLKRRQKRGLRHVVRRLQQELLVLGLLSLMLVAFEGYFLKICLPCSGSCSWDCPAPSAAAEGGQRRMLAEGSLDEKSCLEAAETCPPGSEPFWSQLALIQAHIFVFSIAATHICYACVSMLLCLWKLRRWHRYELLAVQGVQLPLSSLPQPGRTGLHHAALCTVAMLTGGVDAQVYVGLRHLFVERLDVDASFDFYSFLVESMEEEFSSIIGVNFIMWLLVLLWVMLPSQAYQMVWMTGIAVALAWGVGVKLHSIVITLAADACRLYGSPAESPPPSTMLHNVKMLLRRLTPFSGSGQLHERIQAARKDGGDQHEPASPCDGQTWRQQRKGAHAGEPVDAGETDAALRASKSVLLESALGEDGAGDAEDGETSGDGTGQAAEAAEALVEEGAAPLDAAVVAAAAERVSQQDAEAQAADVVGVSSADQRAEPAWAAQSSAGCVDVGNPACQPRSPKVEQPLQQTQEQLERRWGELAFDLESQQQPHQAARAAADSAASPHPRSSVIRRCLPAALLRCLPWHQVQRRRHISQAVERSQDFSASYRGPDAASLFWFGKPRMLLRVVQLIYFENSLSVAAVLFSLWQGVDFDWSRYGGWPFLVVMIGVEMLLLLFMSFTVLPVYALTTAAGSHSAASVIKHALKKNVKPDIARALQRMSVQQPRTPEVQEQEEDGGGDGGAPAPGTAAAASDRPESGSCGPYGHGQGLRSSMELADGIPAGNERDTEADQDQRSLTRLMGAMYQRQLQRHLERASAGRVTASRVGSDASSCTGGGEAGSGG